MRTALTHSVAETQQVWLGAAEDVDCNRRPERTSYIYQQARATSRKRRNSRGPPSPPPRRVTMRYMTNMTTRQVAEQVSVSISVFASGPTTKRQSNGNPLQATVNPLHFGNPISHPL